MNRIRGYRAAGLIEINAAVLLFGLAGLFGKILPLPPLVIVFGRTVFASAALFLVLFVLKRSKTVRSKKDFFLLAVMGAILAVHWLCFFYSQLTTHNLTHNLTLTTLPIRDVMS